MLERKYPHRYGRTDRIQVPAARELSTQLLEALAGAQESALMSSFLNKCERVVGDFVRERARQNEKHPGTVDFPDGTSADFAFAANSYREQCDEAVERGECTWTHVLLEEVFEAISEVDVVKLRAELVQVMAVAGRWIETLDSRTEHGL